MNRMYFIGVTTAQSAIHQIFPRWAALAGVPDAELTGIDLAIGSEPADYRAAVERIVDDPQARGALITTHKVAIYEQARDRFTDFDEDARQLGEVSCIVRREGSLAGLAMDTVAGSLALQTLLPPDFRGTALILGAGGAALALATCLFRNYEPADAILTDISAERLNRIRERTPARLVPVTGTEDHDRLIADLPPGSLIVNATGMGKDRPGSPIGAAAQFPAGAIAWELNYRGELTFLRQARDQGVRAFDGWDYFLRGWSQIMARVFGFEITPELFERMRDAAGAS